MSGSYLGKSSRHGKSITPLARAGVFFYTNHLLLLRYASELHTIDNPWGSGLDPCEYRVGATVFVVISCWNLLLRLLDRWVGA